MSLLVYVASTDAAGEETQSGEPLAGGFESWRTDIWASPQVRALGAQFFPRLATGNLVRIAPDEVQAFQRECALLRENLDVIAGAVDLSSQHGIAVDMESGQVINPAAAREAFRDLVSVHLANFEDAARRAELAGGAVMVW